jgi:hypothetical protein
MIYVASSWRNAHQQKLVMGLLAAGLEVYDFKNPPNKSAFSWASIDPEWQRWDFCRYRTALGHPLAKAGYDADMGALRACSSCVLCLPAGRSACLEAGHAKGAGKYLAVYWPDDAGEAELMMNMADFIADSMEVLSHQMVGVERSLAGRPCRQRTCKFYIDRETGT